MLYCLLSQEHALLVYYLLGKGDQKMEVEVVTEMAVFVGDEREWFSRSSRVRDRDEVDVGLNLVVNYLIQT